MKLEKAIVFEYKGEKFINICIFSKDDVEYSFANKVLEDESDGTEEYAIFYIENNEPTKLYNEELANQLLPLAQEKIKEEINMFIEGEV